MSDTPTTATNTIFPEGWEKSFYEEKIEASFLAIKKHVRMMDEHGTELWAAVVKLMPPVMCDIGSPRRTIAIQTKRAMEENMHALGRLCNAMEANIKAMAVCSRLAEEYKREEMDTTAEA